MACSCFSKSHAHRHAAPAPTGAIGATPEPLRRWRKALQTYVSAVRAQKARRPQVKAFWTSTLELFASWGIGVDQQIDPLSREADAWVDQMWSRLVVDLSGAEENLVGSLASAAKGAANIVQRQVNKRIPVTWDEALPVLMFTIKALQVGEHMGSVKQSKRRESKRVKADACKPPRARKGDAARCNGDWDSVVACVVRAGGLKSTDPEAAELIYAAGDRRHVPPKVLQRKGKPWAHIAHVLTEQGFVPPDSYGRPDEQRSLKFFAEALRGGPNRAYNTPHQCATAKEVKEEIARYVAGKPKASKKRKARKASSGVPSARIRRVVSQALRGLPPGNYQIIIER